MPIFHSCCSLSSSVFPWLYWIKCLFLYFLLHSTEYYRTNITFNWVPAKSAPCYLLSSSYLILQSPKDFWTPILKHFLNTLTTKLQYFADQHEVRYDVTSLSVIGLSSSTHFIAYYCWSSLTRQKINYLLYFLMPLS